MMREGEMSDGSVAGAPNGGLTGDPVMLEPSAETMRWAEEHAPLMSAEFGVITGTFVVALVAATILHRRHAADAARHGGAFRRLARGAGICGRDCRLLRRLCNVAGLETGGGVFFSEGCFDHVAKFAPPGKRVRQRLAEVRQKIFHEAPRRGLI